MADRRDNRHRGICFDFNSRRGCRRPNCRFPHVRDNRNSNSTGAPPQHSHTHRGRESTTYSKLQQWLRRLTSAGHHDVSKFLTDALELVEADTASMQEVIQTLASEEGMHMVAAVCERQTSTTDLENHMMLFKIIAHPSVVASALLEMKRDQICGHLYGLGGHRFLSLFEFIMSKFKLASNLDVDELLSALQVFLDICRARTGAAIDPKSSILGGDLAIIVRNNIRVEHGSSYQLAQGILARIDKHLGLGLALDPLPNIINSKATIVGEKPHFVIDIDPPGTRHNNDKLDICEISVMPTMEEIMSNKAEYLPTVDPNTWNPTASVEGLLDRQFRLLREDTIGQLRDAVRVQIEDMRSNRGKRQRKDVARMNIYQDIQILDICCDRFSTGLNFWVSFAQLDHLRKENLTNKARESFWSGSKRLEKDALLCLVNSSARNGFAIFCSVTGTRSVAPKQKDETEKRSREDELRDIGLSGDKFKGYLKLSLVSSNTADDRHILTLLSSTLPGYLNNSRPNVTLVEFPGILLPSFGPVLKSLQDIKRAGRLPFTDLLGPVDAENDGRLISVPPPSYARATGFKFDLSCITNNGEALDFIPGQPFDATTLSQKSSLDEAQAKAVINALNSKIALIQGPPGTGKSYCGVQLSRVLLHNRVRAKLGPIVVVCYTNHALDQNLEHLLQQGVSQIIRIGSRSKSELLENLNLRTVVRQNASRTKNENRTIHDLLNEIESIAKQLETLSVRLSTCHTWDSISQHLAIKYPHHFRDFEGIDDEGFQEVRNKNKGTSLHGWLNGNAGNNDNEPRPNEVLTGLHLDSLTNSERKSLYFYWMKGIKSPMLSEVQMLTAKHQRTQTRLKRTMEEEDLRCLQQAFVIGVTSSGLARNIDLLSRLPSKVIIMEEAGELQESHTLVSLLPKVEHVILIGDHAQLRPQINSYDLSRESGRGEQYSLDMSLFERLVEPIEGTRALKIPHSTLEIQRRMHPSISQLIRVPLYPLLQDDPSVLDYPEVIGMAKRLFWLDHNHPEGGAENHLQATSRWNQYEIDMVVALTSHLIKQGYSTGKKIAILTPYLKQLFELRNNFQTLVEVVVSERDENDLGRQGLNTESLGNDEQEVTRKSALQSIRVATIDNFQGEEADVIILSLVRSNSHHNCGFVKTPNRINVLLSRAKHGMYIVGNSETFEHVPMWGNTIQMLKESDCFGQSLELTCPRHPETPIAVDKAADFATLSPEGGCQLPCGNRLSCGHVCRRPCHSEVIHSISYCDMDCPRLLPCNHACTRLCGDVCPKKCDIPIDMPPNFVLPCGHKKSQIPCWQSQDPSLHQCRELVMKTVPGCGHVVELECYKNVDSYKYFCKERCNHILPCGHTCARNHCDICVKRSKGKDELDVKFEIAHAPCRSPCGRNFTTCSHSCQRPCHPKSECGVCIAECSNRCEHSKCDKRCGEPCPPCAEDTCKSSCPHSTCLSPCAVPCTHIPCGKRCENTLSCGHRCPSLCGEICPPAIYCQICGNEDMKRTPVDYILFEEYASTNLDEDPILVPKCGHFLTTSTFDGLMAMDDYYERSESGELFSIASESRPFSSKELKHCPTCRGSLATIRRYGRISRRALLDQLTKKLMTWCTQKLHVLYTEVQNEQDRLIPLQIDEKEDAMESQESGFDLLRSKTPNLSLLKLQGSVIDQFASLKSMEPKRYQKLHKLHERLLSLCRRVSKDEQPFQKVYGLVENFRMRGKDISEFKFDDTVLQPGLTIKVETLKIRCELLILSDLLHIIHIRPGMIESPLDVGFSHNVQECRDLIEAARRTVKPREETQGNIFASQYLYFWASNLPAGHDDEREGWLDEARTHLEDARALIVKNPGSTVGLIDEVEAIQSAVGGRTFYQSVTSDEMRAVTAAMREEFRGTGHWYYCVNDHPFTIGECGMPMEEARCPECGERVGGREHRAVAGVRSAVDIERGIAGLRI